MSHADTRPIDDAQIADQQTFPGLRLRLTPIGVHPSFTACNVVLADRLILGRSSSQCAVHIPGDEKISRQHCELIRKDDKVLVRDLNTTNGIRVNGIQISGLRRLEPDDILLLGRTELRISILPPMQVSEKESPIRPAKPERLKPKRISILPPVKVSEKEAPIRPAEPERLKPKPLFGNRNETIMAKEGNWPAGERVPRTGTYKCIYCGPDGMGASIFKRAIKNMGVPYTPPAYAQKKPPLKFFKEGDIFPSCPNCKDHPGGIDPTGWDFVSEKGEATKARKVVSKPNMVHFECTRPSGDGTCSDDSCPCGYHGANIPRGSGYFYISIELVEMRRDALTLDAIQKKVLIMQIIMDAIMMTATSVVFMPVVFMPILMCEQGAKKRRLDLAVAAADAKHWWETGLAPLRPTPMTGRGAASQPAKDTSGCFIATACYGAADCTEVLEFRRFRDENLLATWFGRRIVSLYYRVSPPLAAMVSRNQTLRSFIKRFVLEPAFNVLSRK
jgi:hypothetical protein